ncbi:cyclic nucleotide-binding protein [Acidovorax sp. HMWF029]|uniref:protein kinase domain-containing protein n=1 Tax=Acidovorax sp. HMWF029 TaxID=2056863 RepID=UPI000D3CA5B9|nr:protein kinase [Acidovorax sp. HMWF029]PTT18937.1 cyclic nucleotide-binding protein [Acidovorax sp. HMWF029]
MATATSAPPVNIGKYRIERELGRGASGIVYLGLDGFRGRKVAIKQTHAHLLKAPELAERYRKLLRNEAALSGRLRHPNIVRLLDADEEALPPYLVLEYVDGQPLSDFATPDTLLPMPQVLDIAFKCCNALDYACREGLVHRDIKPANLMLARDGDVKLTDFGAALSLRSDATQLSGLVGSPSYMSPEQVREQDLTHHSDMFSLAVVVYELLTGRRPFDGDTDFATLYKISHEAPTPPSLLRAALPSHVDDVLLRALAKDPADRFATWPDFAQALLAAHRGLPRQKSQDTEAERFARLRALPFFADFHDVALWELMRLGSWRRLERGTVLMRENTPGDSFCILIEGQIAISRQGWNLSTLGPGVTLGEMTYLRPDNRTRTATAVAETEVLVLKVRNPALRQASEDLQSRFDKAFIKLLVGRLIATNEQLAEWELVAAPGGGMQEELRD